MQADRSCKKSKRSYTSIIIWGICTVIVCAILLIAIKRWNIWFGNPTETPYAAQQTPTHLLLTFGQNGATSRCVTWQCDTTLQEACVEYIFENSGDTIRIPASGEKFTSQGGSSIFYRTDIPVPATGNYTYRVKHPHSCSDWRQFSVRHPQPGQPVEFIYLGDIQDTIGGITGQTTRDIATQYPTTDFFLLGGDFIHRPLETYWDEAFRSIDSIAGTCPILAVTGNHEYLKGMNNKAEARFPLHFAYYLNSYRKTGCCFHTIRYGDAELYLIDSNANPIRLFQQRNALKRAFSSSEAKWKIVILHHPPYSIRNPHNNLDIKFLFVPLFNRYGADLVLAGHEHGYARRSTRSHDNDLTTPVYTVSHCSPKQYPLHIGDAERYGTGDRYYQQIILQEDTMQMNTYTTDHSLYDQIKLVKKAGKTIVTDLSDGIPERIEMPAEVAKRIKPKALRKYRKTIDERTRK